MKREFDPALQKIVDDFDAHAKKRAVELLARTESEPLARLIANLSEP